MNIKKYNEIADKNKPQKQVLKHTASAFLVGGVIGMIGEFFLNLYNRKIIYLQSIQLKKKLKLILSSI